MADELNEFVERLSEAHKDNLISVVLYGSAAVGVQLDDDAQKKVLIVVKHIRPSDLKAAHEVAEWWRLEGNPPPTYFTSQEIEDSSDVFPIEFIDMSQVRHVVYGKDPFERLDIPTHNLRHQLEYELRGKLIRLRTLYIPAAQNPNRLSQLMANSLDSFAVLFRHVLAMLGKDAPFEKRECVMKLADALKLDKQVFTRIFDYAGDDELWLEAETSETFAGYLRQIERVIETVDKGKDEGKG
ncbi:MAG TPA: hypothetical protein VNI02_18680 [Blastocatellia bacterium]|nr:hypothetical protein [Blastocatellia bacterium]